MTTQHPSLNLLSLQAEVDETPDPRRRLLDASLQMMIIEGLHQVDLESAAYEAEVSIDTTRTLFRDTHHLIDEAFLHYAQNQRDTLNLLWAEVDERQSQITPEDSFCDAIRQKHCIDFVNFFQRAIAQQLNERSDELKLEMLILTGMVLNGRSTEPAESLIQQIYQPLLRLCHRLDNPKPEAQAHHLLNALLSMTYSGIGKPHGPAQSMETQQQLCNLFAPVFGLTPANCSPEYCELACMNQSHTLSDSAA